MFVKIVSLPSGDTSTFYCREEKVGHHYLNRES